MNISQHSAHRRNTVIILHSQSGASFLGIYPHAAEFIYQENFSVLSQAFLFVKYWSSVISLHQQ